MRQLTIGIDVGTTSTKTLLIDAAGTLVAEASRPAGLSSPFPGAAEADPAQWLENVTATVRQVLLGVRADDQVCGVATTGMLPAVVVSDADGHPLRAAILQNDVRADAEVTRLAERLAGFDLVERTGSALTQQSVAPKLMWLQEHEPDVFAQARRVQGSYDWLLSTLGARAHVEQNWALESGLFELATGALFSEAVEAAELPPELLPEALRPGTIAGELSPEWADRLGLTAGTPLVVGGADHVLSAYAAGVEAEGDWLVKLGGAGDILAASDRPVVDPRLYLDAHPVPGRWLPNGCMATSGSLVRWFQAMIGGAGFDALEAEAKDAPAASLLCLPYFLGEKSPLHDPNLRGAYVGLHLGHTRGDLYRATLEAIAFGFRHHTEIMSGMGMSLTRAMITNGGSKSTLWKQIHADVLGAPMNPLANHPGASLGAAVAAAVGVGARDDWSCVSDFVSLTAPFEPDPGRSRRYDEAYLQWRELGAALQPISHRLAGHSHP